MAPNPENYIVHVDIILELFQNGYNVKISPFYHHRQKGKSQHNFMPKANDLRVIPKLATYSHPSASTVFHSTDLHSTIFRGCKLFFIARFYTYFILI